MGLDTTFYIIEYDIKDYLIEDMLCDAKFEEVGYLRKRWDVFNMCSKYGTVVGDEIIRLTKEDISSIIIDLTSEHLTKPLNQISAFENAFDVLCAVRDSCNEFGVIVSHSY